MVEKEKEKVEDYQLVEVPTQTGIAFQNPKGEILTMEQAIVDILNLLNDIKKTLK
jgi:hypothetical protein